MNIAWMFCTIVYSFASVIIIKYIVILRSVYQQLSKYLVCCVCATCYRCSGFAVLNVIEDLFSLNVRIKNIFLSRWLHNVNMTLSFLQYILDHAQREKVWNYAAEKRDVCRCLMNGLTVLENLIYFLVELLLWTAWKCRITNIMFWEKDKKDQ